MECSTDGDRTVKGETTGDNILVTILKDVKEEDSPGFEIIGLISVLGVCLIISKVRKK